ncbi:alpha/beta hydrolase [Rhizobacter sp. J219]|uniref:alpha/beta hydrolase family protein n=1 Tax=Rhizobacter sp. J219 TaxID=2898430 RepID=UPI0021518F84|nr:alpha/beta hydrolase [Rhizobacter sp. J219]MCR5884610.1 alpha/beta hydrolase [Rhizobacter sp. J219]
MKSFPSLRLAAVAGAVLLASCGGGDDDAPAPEETRAQDSRTFTATPATTFAAMPPLAGASQTDIDTLNGTSRWAGVLNGAAYRVEVPANWNGRLVMYAHGYAGTGAALGVNPPSIRRHLIMNGYAWAASSYTKNYYDVRAGVEDTNALALEFNRIAQANSRPLPAPTKLYITGHSMGGHITAAAIEDEAFATARNKVRYHGAVPMCGVTGDTVLFDTFAAMQVSALAVAGIPNYPFTRWSEVSGLVTGTLFQTFPTPAAPTTPITTTAVAGARYASIVENLTGGPRPLFAQGLQFGGSFPSAYGTFGGDGTVNGILNRPGIDTNAFTYTITGDATTSAAINAAAQKVTADPEANRLRRDGLRWIPKVNGEFRIPVVAIHTLGDLFVPFNMLQVYAQRTAARGNSQYLVTRAIRGASHCDFTIAEQVQAFSDMVAWEAGGARPAGDDVLTPATVAAPTYGCTFTNNTRGQDESGTVNALRPAIVAQVPCP